MSIILNLGISDSFQRINYAELQYPGKMLVDYVRVSSNLSFVTCSLANLIVALLGVSTRRIRERRMRPPEDANSRLHSEVSQLVGFLNESETNLFFFLRIQTHQRLYQVSLSSSPTLS